MPTSNVLFEIYGEKNTMYLKSRIFLSFSEALSMGNQIKKCLQSKRNNFQGQNEEIIMAMTTTKIIITPVIMKIIIIIMMIKRIKIGNRIKT